MRKLFFIALLILVQAKFSVTWSVAAPAHSFDCKTCHLADKAFVDLDGNICLSCHGTGLNLKASAGFSSDDASNQYGNNPAPGDETSHHWAATSTNPAAGASEPYSYPGFYSNYGTSVGKVTCTRCHQPHGDQTINPKLLTTTASGYRAFTAAPLTPDQMCLACHAEWNQTGNDGWLTHPLVADYNASLLAEPDKYKANLENRYNAAIQLVDGGVSCTSCHGVHFVDSDSSTVDGPAAAGSLSQSDGKLLRGDGPNSSDKSSLCQTCHTYEQHGDNTGEKVGCLICHGGHSYDPEFPNFYVLRKEATTKTFNTVTGLDYIAADALWNDGNDGSAEGYCERCHGDAAAISSGDYHNTLAICSDCHTHMGDTFVSHGGASGNNCIACHGHDAGTLYDVDQTAPYTAGSIPSLGRGTAQSHSTHTETDVDDLKGPGLYCDACHDINNFPFFKSGIDADGDGRYGLSETDVCNTCHSPGGSYDGIDDPVIGAKNNWKNGVYIDGDLIAGKEKWCVTCHDHNPSIISAVAAPNIAGNESEAYPYGTGWGYYKTGHGLVPAETYPASGGTSTGAGIGCDACHDFTTSHIDGMSRTYDDGDNSALDPSFYRIGYRLKRVAAGTGSGVDGQEPLQVPNSEVSPDAFRLCVNCHPFYPAFSDPNDLSATNMIFNGANRHPGHLGGNSWASDWSGATNSGGTCMTCHNVHGSIRLAMIRDGKLISREPGMEIWYKNDSLTTLSNPPSPQNLPLTASDGIAWYGISSARLCSQCHGVGVVGVDRLPSVDVARAPNLSWVASPGYRTDGAHPDAPMDGSNVEFRVVYSDLNNDAPTAIEVWIDSNDNAVYESGEKLALSETDAADLNLTDGKIYSRAVALSQAGDNVLTYRFYATDGVYAANGPATAGGSVTILSIASGSLNAPVLAWTGEAGYAADGATPDAGKSGDTFIFRVDYTDRENDPPAVLQVWVDTDVNGAFSEDEKHDMSVDGGDGNYANGERFSKTLAVGGDGSVGYRFYATDGNQEATGAPMAGGTLAIDNRPPTLTWNGGAGFAADGVDPDSGTGGSGFTFRVSYSDPDNSAPGIIQVWVDADDSGSFEEDEKHDLVQDAPDNDFTDGASYVTTAPLPLAATGDGSITYRFHASDGFDPATGVPVTDHAFTITSPAGNASPVLSWASANCLTAGVRPHTGAHNTDFEFLVDYTDADGQCAATIFVHIDENDDGRYESSEKFAMAEADPTDLDCGDGKTYTFSKTIKHTGDGTLNYRYYATDGYVSATGLPTGGGTFVILDNVKKVRPSGGTGWYDTLGAACGAAIDQTTVLVYPEGDYTPATYNQNLSIMYKDGLTLRSACGPDLTIISGSSGVYIERSPETTIDGFAIMGASIGISIGYTSGDIVLHNNKIHTNGEGIHINASDQGTVSIEDSEIYNNTGRAIYSFNTNTQVSGSNIHDNSATVTGAGIYIRTTNSSGNLYAITDSRIDGNATSAGGAGVYLDSSYLGASSATIRNTVISNNSTTGIDAAGYGAGLYVKSIDVDVDKTRLISNSATNSAGGGLHLVGNAIFRNSIIADNRALKGGGAYLFNGTTAQFTNVTFADNRATAGNGGAILQNYLTNNTVRNSIFWNNIATGSGDVAFKEGTYTQFLTVTDSNISTGAGNIDGGTISASNNITPAQDPLFAGSGDYHLQSGSPVIDQANPAFAPVDDIDGDSRPQGSTDDIGADEYVP